MAKLWLPIKEQQTGRETILYIPGASTMDQGQLREIIAKQTEKIREEARAKGPRPHRVYSKDQVAGALKEFREYLERKRRSR